MRDPDAKKIEILLERLRAPAQRGTIPRTRIRELREPRDERTCGWVRTAMAERSAKTEAERRGISVEQVWRERAAIYPQNRVLEPREVAQVIAFLCSDAAGGVNGEAITVALGGMW